MFEKIIETAKDKLRNNLKYIGLILFFLLTLSLVRNITKISQVGKRIDDEVSRLEKLKEENLQLKNRLEEVGSGEYIERELRDKLGFAKVGETIVVLPPEDVVKSLAPKETREEEALPEPNWKRWLHLFF